MKTFKEYENIDEACEECIFEHEMEGIQEAEYQGKKVKLNDPVRGGSKKFYVYVKNETGNVVKVLVKAGQVVQEGDSLLIIEAMKMETSISAPRSGTVADIKVQSGDACAVGDSLVTLA